MRAFPSLSGSRRSRPSVLQSTAPTGRGWRQTLIREPVKGAIRNVLSGLMTAPIVVRHPGPFVAVVGLLARLGHPRVTRLHLEMLYRFNRLEAAALAVDRAMSRFPGHPAVLSPAFRIAWVRNDHERLARLLVLPVDQLGHRAVLGGIAVRSGGCRRLAEVADTIRRSLVSEIRGWRPDRARAAERLADICDQLSLLATPIEAETALNSALLQDLPASIAARLRWHLARTLVATDRFEEALPHLRAVLEQPQPPSDACETLYNALLCTGAPDAELQAVEHDWTSRNGARERPGLAALRNGDHVGYFGSRSRRRMSRDLRILLGDRATCPRGGWARPFGDHPRAGRHFFVIGHDGAADEIRWSQHYAELHAYFDHVSISCDPRLAPLLRRSMPECTIWPVRRRWPRLLWRQPFDGRSSLPTLDLALQLDDAVWPHVRGADEVGFDDEVAVRLWRTARDRSPPPRKKAGWLRPCPERARAWRARLGSGASLNVGVQWRSALVSSERATHFLSLREVEPLLRLRDEGIRFVLLQPGLAEDERRIAETAGVIDPAIDLYDDFEEIAALVATLDLVLGISSVAYELAAATGTEVWLAALTPHAALVRSAPGDARTDRLTPGGRLFPPSAGFGAPRDIRAASIVAAMAMELTARVSPARRDGVSNGKGCV
jgi:hypothetical protein